MFENIKNIHTSLGIDDPFNLHVWGDVCVCVCESTVDWVRQSPVAQVLQAGQYISKPFLFYKQLFVGFWAEKNENCIEKEVFKKRPG